MRIAVVLALAAAGVSRAEADDSTSERVTYTKHIAALLWKHCAECHRPGEIGPFPLMTYRDAAKRAEFLVAMTSSRRMPPWKPEPGFLKFHGERRLSDEEIELLARWAADDAPEGDPADLPPPPRFTDEWQLGPPDLVLKMTAPFSIPADGRDRTRCFVVPIPIDGDRMVSAVEFRPGNRRVVHHAVMFLDADGAARRIDGQDGRPGYDAFGGPVVVPTGGLGAWLPGTRPRHLPEGMSKYLKHGSDLVLQVHYHPSGKPETDQSSVGIYFSKKPTEKIVTGIAVVQPLLRLPAGRARCDVRTRCVPLPVDVHVLGVSPHMHDLGREFKVTARLPGGGEMPLIRIKDWDFNWQGSYQFDDPIRLPKGSVICVHAVYDNSADNPKNPHDPPREVRWGDQSSDEMCLCGVEVFTDTMADLKLLAGMPAFELAIGLVGGIPDHTTEQQPAAKGQASGGTPAAASLGGWTFPPEGIRIPASHARVLVPFDKDKNGRLSRREISKMSGPMQAWLLRWARASQPQ